MPIWALGLAAFSWTMVQAMSAWRYRSEFARAEKELARGEYAQARERWARLAERWPGRGELEYPLGGCEASLGHVDAALRAWGRVPSGSAQAPQAALDRARLALEHGRLTVAEESLARALGRADAIGDEAASAADQLDLFAGRSGAILARIERRWSRARDPAGLLRLHWQVDARPFPVLAIAAKLEQFGREAPNDDRVWLGRADLARRAGKYAEADEWLRRCEARRPQDRDVALARLNWALDARRLDVIANVARRLPASSVTPSMAAHVAAKAAEVRGDFDAERAALERLVALVPGATSAWERLADLAARAGDTARVAEARRRKAEMDRALDEYQKLMGAAAPEAQIPTAELGRLAETLGRRFEARGWWTMRAREAPDDANARAALERLTSAPRPSPTAPGAMLAELPLIARAIAGTETETNVTAAADVATSSKAKAHDRRGAPDPAAVPRSASSNQAAPQLAVPLFRDDAERAGLHFTYDNDPTPLCRMPETMGGGVGLIDYDGDGWLDVYAVQGGPFPNTSVPPRSPQGDRLFRNRGDGTFEDVTDAAGLLAFPGGYGHGATVGDYDNDGRPDLFITRWRSYALYRNRGDGTFEDVTDAAGLGGPRDWPTSAAFGDLDGDGDLDLYVCHYAAWDPMTSAPCPHPDDPNRHAYCVPRSLEAMPDHVFRNDKGRFVDVTASAGAVDPDGRGLGVVIADLDEDGLPDIYVANDMTANLMFRNLGGFRFEEVAAVSGVAASGEGGYQAGMGIARGDLDGDGRLDLAVTNFYGESTTFYQNLGPGQFADRTAAIGLAGPSRHVLGFGVAFFDADNDGRPDIAQTNGHVNDYRPGIPYAMPGSLLLMGPSGRLVDVGERAGTPWGVERLGRGLALGDLDNDGRLDLVIVAEGSPLAYFHNQGPAGRFIDVLLEGAPPRSNRDAIGARVELKAAGRRQVAERFGGGSFLSASDPRLHFGLGETTRVDSIEVRWPSGRVDEYKDLSAGSVYRLREGRAEAQRERP